MRALSQRITWAMVAVGVLSGLPMACSQTSDVGRPCLMVKSDGDGGTAPILESELDENRDLLSFGALECDDFICVRHRYAPLTRDEEGNLVGTVAATGTCASRCTPGSAGACEVLSPEASLADGPFTCRALLLDEESLNVICNADPDLCDRLFGANRTPYYCAQGAERVDGGTPDAGGT